MVLALGLTPLQLLNLGPLFSLGFARGFYTRTPRGQLARALSGGIATS